MPEVRTVKFQVYAPTESFTGQVSEGYFVVERGVLTMTSADGAPILDQTGQPVFTHRLEPGQDAQPIASVLAKKVRRYLRGETEELERFRRPLEYPKTGIA